MTRRRRTWRRGDAGTSLVEVLVTTAVVTVALGLAATTFGAGLARTDELEQRIGVEADARLVLDGLRSELRQAYTGTSSMSPVAAISASTITFYSPEATTPFHLRRITYRVVAGTLQRAASASALTAPPWTPFAADVFRPVLGDVVGTGVFTGLDATGTTTTDPQAVSAVRIALQIDPSVGRGLGPVEFAVTVDLRSIS